MTALKYYYNLNRCISDGKTQFDTTNMPKETYEVNGQIYSGSNDLMDLLNELHEENEDRFNEQMYLQKQLHNTQKELEPIRKICKKYRIPIKDLPEILEEDIAYDNDDNW